MKLSILYCVNKSGGIQEWKTWTENDKVIVEHGQLNGKMQRKETVCTSKNIGRSNETTPEEQAILEAQSKYNKQYDKYYRETVEEARELLTEGVMLAQDYTKKPHLLDDEFYASFKIDGLRVKTSFVNGEPTWTSRGGKSYPVPIHLVDQLKVLKQRSGVVTYDGEAYIHGQKLQKIQSAVKKPNELSSQITYEIFDVPTLGVVWGSRMNDLNVLEKHSVDLFSINIVQQNLAAKENLEEFLHNALVKGYEGLMLRNKEGEYLFQNKRSNDLLKYKLMLESEAKVIDCKCDKNGQGLFTMEWYSSYSDQVVTFELSMNGSQEDNTYDKLVMRMGEWVNFSYQDHTEAGKPTFARGIYFRECNEHGEPLE